MLSIRWARNSHEAARERVAAAVYQFSLGLSRHKDIHRPEPEDIELCINGILRTIIE